MKVKRMVLLASMALAVVAFAAPVPAGAIVQLKGVNVGGGVTGTSINLRMTTSSGTFECESVVGHGTLVVNGPNHVVVEPIGEATTSNCVLNAGIFKLPVTVTHATASQGTGNTWGTGIGSVSFTIDIAALGLTCTFHGNVHGQASAPNSDVGIIGPSALTGTGANCPSTGIVHGSGTGTRSNGTPLEGEFVPTG